MTKLTLFKMGVVRINKFCNLNHLPVPEIRLATEKDDWTVGACAYYRPQYIHVHLPSCASPATENQVRNWNWPGSVTDREPYGVLCHELGHHIDWLTGEKKYRYSSNYCEQVMEQSGEKEITSYCPNPAEWFAEMFRVFVTNYPLLAIIRPVTAEILRKKFKPLNRHMGREWWEKELGVDVPARILANLVKKTRGL